MFEIYSLVMLSVALPQLQLKPGALGVVVYIHGAGEAYEVEFITNDGQTIAVATIASNHLRQASASFHGYLDDTNQDSLRCSDPAVPVVRQGKTWKTLWRAR
ncbi:DUF4926 domain-containing protein [Paucibacter sp. AS339]|uniref:DUF4926 domain-containing protein n=1 Tax=Paucibacter hankyongi TaxID=3133434 RepID=UPI00309D6F9C